MISSLQVTNFRGFRSVQLSNLPRFNILTGQSASGKTALLEALWIVGGVSPEIYFRMRAMRGMGDQPLQIKLDKRSYEGVFGDMFYDSSNESGIDIDIMDSDSGSRHLNISYDRNHQITLELAPRVIDSSTAIVKPLVFLWRLGEKEYRCQLKFGPAGQIIVENPPEAYPAIFISSSSLSTSAENAERLSALSIRKEKQKLVEVFQRIFPYVESLDPQTIAGQSMVWVSIKGLQKQIPIASVSSGANKYLSILLAISQHPGGVILIDEIENGFYFRGYETIFETFVEFCENYRVQLFASTHNWEFLKAVSSVMAKREKDVSILRTSLREGNCEVSALEGVDSIAAIEENIDLRA